MRKTMFKLSLFAALLSAGVLMAVLCGCSKGGDTPQPSQSAVSQQAEVPAEEETPTETETPAETETPTEAETPVETETPTEMEEPSETDSVPGRQAGERYDNTIILEGMEETVHYEHMRSDVIGFEMDYDYELLVHTSEAGRECFYNAYGYPEQTDDYLEVAYSTEDAETVAASITDSLSDDYELSTETFHLDAAGDCIRIVADEEKGTGRMPEYLQTIYVIPAEDGCRVATEHYYIAEAEGLGHRFAYMMQTFTVIPRQEVGITGDQALSAIRNYCYERNPDLEGIVNAGEYPVGWEITSEDETEIVVWFRSYTGSSSWYHIDPISGETYVTEYVPGIMTEEQRTEESFNVREYLD